MIDDNNTPEGTVGEDPFLAFADDLEDQVTDTQEVESDEPEEDAETALSSDDGEDENAADEDAPEDDGSDADEAEDEEDDDAPEQDEDTAAQQPVDESVSVTMDDGSQITVAELKKGYLRQSDYTRKRQEESQIAQRAEQLSQQYSQSLQQAQMIAQAFMPKRPDPALLDYDQAEYLRQERAFNQAQQYVNHLQGQHQQLSAQEQQKQAEQRQAMIAAERQKLMETMPELKSEPARQKMQAELAEAVKSFGFEPNELENVYDHRVIKALVYANKALQAEKSQKAVKKKVAAKAEKAAPVAKPKQKNKLTGKAARRAELTAKLKKTGNPLVADKLFEDFV